MRERKVLIYAGTTEGRRLAEYLVRRQVRVHVCVATEYGESLLPKGEQITVTHKRMDCGEMCGFIREYAPSYVIDATHPYAKEATENLKRACGEVKVPYIRLLRECGEADQDHIYVENIEAAVAYLANTEGNILAVTGSKELEAYTSLEGYQERVYARVLSTGNVALKCEQLGFAGRHLICMQGPFSTEMNVALLREYDITYMVTKESGVAGGYPQKCEAAAIAGVKLIVIGRPEQENGYTYYEIIKILKKGLNLQTVQKITLTGIGMGHVETFTIGAKKVCAKAELLIGAGRMLQASACEGQAVFAAYQPEVIVEYIRQHPEYETIAIVLSGDPGFYSGAKKLLGFLEKEPQMEVEVLPGISSVAYLCAKLKVSWEDAALVSIHGRNENLLAIIKGNKKTFVLTGTGEDIRRICRRLTEVSLGDLRVCIGVNLSYENEEILEGCARDYKDYDGEKLAVLYIENPAGGSGCVTHGIPDSAFIRGDVPMTKEEVRSVSLSKLGLRRDSIVYDIGAGTGSAGIEAALQADRGHVYAIEVNPEAIRLIRENCQKFGVDNLTVIEGAAPEVLEDLPAPDHVFIGGSKGHMEEILRAVAKKNPKARIVINAIALETLHQTVECLSSLKVIQEEITQVSVSKDRCIGKYHMMMGQNPVYIISFTLDVEEVAG